MERGFDKLMTPDGIALVLSLMFFTLFLIILGANIVRFQERKKRQEKERQKEE